MSDFLSMGKLTNFDGMTFAQRAIRFHKNLTYTGGALPPGIRIMNPFKENPEALRVTSEFLEKYFDDNRKRHLILGINPGRFGAGLTGIGFTDPKRLVSECHIAYHGRITHEPSSVFIYDMIKVYGGPKAFYHDFYINSPCPLGFTSIKPGGKEVNYNYYDSRELIEATTPFILQSIRKLIRLGVFTDTCICLGTGKNARFLQQLNEEHRFFKTIVPLEHPRFIMQYKLLTKDHYIRKYLEVLHSVLK
ncbi:MAG: uracil-DNA glycosylase family protein [Chitinophagaceae bacterium]